LCTTSPSEEVLTKSIVFIGYNDGPPILRDGRRR
jgi:hypothetical protein